MLLKDSKWRHPRPPAILGLTTVLPQEEAIKLRDYWSPRWPRFDSHYLEKLVILSTTEEHMIDWNNSRWCIHVCALFLPFFLLFFLPFFLPFEVSLEVKDWNQDFISDLIKEDVVTSSLNLQDELVAVKRINVTHRLQEVMIKSLPDFPVCSLTKETWNTPCNTSVQFLPRKHSSKLLTLF